MSKAATEFLCPSCGNGTMSLETIPEYPARLSDFPFVVTNAQVFRCSSCGDFSINATELKRWRILQRQQLIRQVREELDLSSADLASLLGVTRQAVHNWEHGRRQGGPALLLVRMLAEELAGNVQGCFSTLCNAASSQRIRDRFGQPCKQDEAERQPSPAGDG